jgi:hypothetical protein
MEGQESSFGTQKRYWRVGKKSGLLLAVIILAGLSVFAYSQYRASLQPAELGPVPVTVLGMVRAIDASKTPVRVDVGACAYNNCAECDSYGYNCSPGCSVGQICYTADHSAAVSNGRYSTVLMNHYTYDVFLVYKSQGVQSYCYAGHTNIEADVSGTYTYDVSC